MRLDGVVDLEAAHWTRVVVAGCYSPKRGAHTFRHLSDLVDKLLAWRGWWWTWAGGHYDLLAVAEELRRRGLSCQVFLAGSRVTQLVVGDLRLVDAYALIPLSLDVAAEIPGLTAPRLGWPCRCGESCDGYCSITDHMDLDLYAQLAEYCAADCRVAYAVVAHVLQLFADLGYVVRGTIGGTAWATAQKWLRLPSAKWHWSTFRRVRRAYYGGRVCVGAARAYGGGWWDMRSAYPAALARERVPIGEPAELGAERAARAYRNDVPGVYRMTVRIPDSLHVPPLPWRSPSGRLAYPTGTIRGTWTSSELNAAEQRGCKLLSAHGGVVWPDGAEAVYAPMVEHWFAQRAAAGPTSALGRLYREMPNALTGKLAESPERLAVAMHPDPTKRVICDGRSARSRASQCTVRECTGRCGAWRQLDEWGHIWGIPLYRQGGSAHVHHAAILTASTRLRWLDAADAAGDNLVYGDTDSILIADEDNGYGPAPEPPDVGEGLGQWVPQRTWGAFECLGPKRYRYVDGGTGEVVCRAAGVSRMDARVWDAMKHAKHGVTEARGVQTFKEAAASGRSLFERRVVTRRFSEGSRWRGDRMLALSGDRTYPVAREQIEERDRRG